MNFTALTPVCFVFGQFACCVVFDVVCLVALLFRTNAVFNKSELVELQFVNIFCCGGSVVMYSVVLSTF